MAKKPPPPNSHTVRRNGFSRVQKLNADVERLVDERHAHVRAQRDVREAEHADCERRQPEVEARLDPVGGDVEVGRVAEPVERDELLERVDERQRPGELDAVVLLEHDVDVGLLARREQELDLLEVEDDERVVADEAQLERRERARHERRRLCAGLRRRLELDREVELRPGVGERLPLLRASVGRSRRPTGHG